MIIFGYTQVTDSDDELYFYSKEPDVLQQLYNELVKVQQPTRLVSLSNNNGMPFTLTIKHKKNSLELYYWAARWLCHDGWEPFSVSHYAVNTLDLRKVINRPLPDAETDRTKEE